MSLVDATENALLDHFLGGPDYTRLATVYLALSTTTPTDAGGNFTEPTGGSYARVAITNNATNFPAASGGAKSNGVKFSFPTATADWSSGANMTYIGLFDAATAGNLIAYGAITTPKAVLNGDTAEVAIGDLDVTMD